MEDPRFKIGDTVVIENDCAIYAQMYKVLGANRGGCGVDGGGEWRYFVEAYYYDDDYPTTKWINEEYITYKIN
jgi:hypothetical protein